ncbi:hypothetical protein scyTo_0004876 [Scyliorhinus torazame]|uniref:Uncharacterized protein n=1 Tax=Scyliorhinus torazame TaxID=75743 RepID=A0A401NYE8_SCYTO|nr:hypothetical protein [Scyliorhinus torazame]
MEVIAAWTKSMEVIAAWTKSRGVIAVWTKSCFGKQTAGSLRRGCECIVLETSEMIVVENVSENEEKNLQREVTNRQSRRRFRKINLKGERQTITDNVDSYHTDRPQQTSTYHMVKPFLVTH